MVGNNVEAVSVYTTSSASAYDTVFGAAVASKSRLCCEVRLSAAPIRIGWAKGKLQ